MGIFDNQGVGTTMLVGPTGYGGYGGGYPLAYPVPMAGGYGMGSGMCGDFGSLIVLFLFAMMFGGGFGGYGMGGGLGYDFPWLLNGQNSINNNTNAGFRDAQLSDGLTSIRGGIGDIQMGMANGFANTAAAVTGAQTAISQQMYNNEVANLNRSFAEQTANSNGFAGVNAGIADIKYTIANEGCQTRNNETINTQNVLTALQTGVQSIKDQLCQYRNDQKDDLIAQLRQEVLFARGQQSQDVQTASLRTAGATIANQAIQELRSCPIPAMPVYGMTPIFNCNNGNGGCGCGA